jgi:hypothetical protein
MVMNGTGSLLRIQGKSSGKSKKAKKSHKTLDTRQFTKN